VGAPEGEPDQGFRPKQMNFPSFINWRVIAFYVGVPLFVAIYGGLNNWEIQQAAGYAVAIGFYLSHSFIPWWITGLCNSGLMRILARWKPPPIFIMIPGSIMGCFLVLPYTHWITGIFERVWPTTTASLSGIPGHTWSGDFVEYLIRATVIWVAVNFIFDRFIGLPRYRYSIPRGYENIGAGSKSTPSAGPDDKQPAFITRLPVHISVSEILAIKAEQHYIRVFTSEREYMVLYRFSDAVSQLDIDLGLQVHRSWWIARSAIQSMRQSAKKFFVVLNNGEEVPVSTPYQGLLKEMAKFSGIPVKPQPQNTSTN
jgi:hypothetical protein